MSSLAAGFFRRLSAATVARSLEFLRDRSSLAWNLIFPILLVAGLAFMFSGPGQPLFKVAVIAPAAETLDAHLHPFLETPQVQFYRETDRSVALHKVALQRIDMLVDFTNSPASYWVNEQSSKGKLLERLMLGSGGSPLKREEASGKGMRYVDWVAPGVLGMNIMFSCLFGIGYVIVRYRKSGYLKRLNATPLRAVEFLLAQLLSRLGLILVVNSGVFLACHLLFQLRMDGSYLALLVLTAIATFSMIAMGLVVSSRLTSEELANGVLNILSLPMMVMCGVFFSIDGSPPALQVAARFFPLTHLLEGARAIMLDGAGFEQIAGNLVALSAMSVVYLVLGAALFKWRQD